MFSILYFDFILHYSILHFCFCLSSNGLWLVGMCHLQASLSLPGSPFNIRRGSRASQFSVNWRNGRRYGDRKPLVLQTLVDAQEHLPYADDSNAVTPMSEENGAIIIPMYTNLQQSSYTSHSSRVSYNSHTDIYGKPLTKESQLRSRSKFLLGLYNEVIINFYYKQTACIFFSLI